MRPIVWGFILMVVGGIFWVMFSVIGALGEVATGQKSPLMLALMYIFGIMFFFSLPVAFVIEIVNWFRRRGMGKVEIRSKSPSATLPPTSQSVYYCTKCGKPLKYLLQYQKWYCENCRTYPPTREEILQRASRALDEGNTELAKRLMDQARQ